MSEARWPNLFVVGAPRAGTSSLRDYLDQHPQIFMSRLKEPHYFSRARPRYMPTVSNEADYLRLFRGARTEQLRGEASPSHLYSPVAPDAIAKVSPDARIVIMLRDPVKRAHSAYWHQVRYGRETRPFLEAVRAQLGEQPGGHAQYVRPGLYSTPVERYLSVFGPRVVVLFLEDLARDTRGELRRTFELLRVDPAPAETLRLDVRNASALPRGPLVRFAYRSPRLRALGRGVVPHALHGRAEQLLLRRRDLPALDPEARLLLEPVYAADRPRLEELLGRTVPWAPAAEALTPPLSAASGAIGASAAPRGGDPAA